MRVAFYTAYGRDPVHLLHAVGLVESVHRVMPGVPVVQLTDETTPEVPGVSEVVRGPAGDVTERRLHAYAALPSGEWLLLDTDALVLKNPTAAFMRSADVVVTDRNWSWLQQGDRMMHTMPYNMGVVFSRQDWFWGEVLKTWLAYSEPERDFLSDQRALYQVIRSGVFRVQILPGAVYNYPPKSGDDPCEGVTIAHYKGFRKPWLSDRISQSWRIPANSAESVGAGRA